jgi:hypothetical protein
LTRTQKVEEIIKRTLLTTPAKLHEKVDSMKAALSFYLNASLYLFLCLFVVLASGYAGLLWWHFRSTGSNALSPHAHLLDPAAPKSDVDTGSASRVDDLIDNPDGRDSFRNEDFRKN